MDLIFVCVVIPNYFHLTIMSPMKTSRVHFTVFFHLNQNVNVEKYHYMKFNPLLNITDNISTCPNSHLYSVNENYFHSSGTARDCNYFFVIILSINFQRNAMGSPCFILTQEVFNAISMT